MIPTELAEKKRVMDEYVAHTEARSSKRAFRPENYEWEDPENYRDWRLARIDGVGCEYTLWQLADNTTLITYTASGPWPHASIEWLWSPEPIAGYLPALARIIREIAIDSGGSEADLGLLAFTLAQGS